MLEEEIKNHFLKLLSDILFEDAKECEVQKICLAQLRRPMNQAGNFLKEMDVPDDYMEGNFFIYLCKYLEKKELLEFKQRNSFSTDSEYLEFLSAQDIDLIIGSERAIQPMLDEYKVAIDIFKKDKICIFLDIGDDDILLLKKKMLKLYIHNVQIFNQPCSPEIEQENVMMQVSIKAKADNNGGKAILLHNDWGAGII